ncbi:hypothetical protein [Paraurantiacibacter namhicola]|uniref:hypothetical protein n=1 Tax=Paraurantiacibacter namhicola TaxID=645517 RepID=UPI0012EEAF80|nr:hypothetical protein [Paraurantiacibacter namhicola]
MIKLLLAAAVVATAPYLPGDVIEYAHGEGLVAGNSVLNDRGYWETEYTFGDVGASPVDEARAEIVGKMLAGEELPFLVVANDCSDGMCAAISTHRVTWRSECAVRDLYAYKGMDAVRVEWACGDVEDGFSIVDFESDKPRQVRDFAPDRTIWIKSEN